MQMLEQASKFLLIRKYILKTYTRNTCVEMYCTLYLASVLLVPLLRATKYNSTHMYINVDKDPCYYVIVLYVVGK